MRKKPRRESAIESDTFPSCCRVSQPTYDSMVYRSRIQPADTFLRYFWRQPFHGGFVIRRAYRLSLVFHVKIADALIGVSKLMVPRRLERHCAVREPSSTPRTTRS